MQKSQSFYTQKEPPKLSQIIKLSQPSTQPNTQYYTHLFSSLYIQRPVHKNISSSGYLSTYYIFYKSKTPDIGMLFFQQQSLIAKKTLQIQYSNIKEITTIKTFCNQYQTQNQNNNSNKNQQIILCIGYYDGKIQLYKLQSKAAYDEVAKSAHSLERICFLSTRQPYPVRDIQIYFTSSNSLTLFWVFACKNSFISLYKKPLSDGGQHLIEINKSSLGCGKLQMFLSSPEIKNCYLDKERVVPLWLDKKICIFDELGGIKCYLLPNLIQQTKIADASLSVNLITRIDSRYEQHIQEVVKKLMIENGINQQKYNGENSDYIRKKRKILQQKRRQISEKLINQTIVCGASDDSIKFIDIASNNVIKYSGMKNFGLNIIHDYFYDGNKQNCKDRVWIGCLDGSVYYFQNSKYNQKDYGQQGQIQIDNAECQSRQSQIQDNQKYGKQNKNDEKFKLLHFQLQHGTKIINNGIKKMEICDQIMVILDTQGNLYIFDIIY